MPRVGHYVFEYFCILEKCHVFRPRISDSWEIYDSLCKLSLPYLPLIQNWIIPFPMSILSRLKMERLHNLKSSGAEWKSLYCSEVCCKPWVSNSGSSEARQRMQMSDAGQCSVWGPHWHSAKITLYNFRVNSLVLLFPVERTGTAGHTNDYFLLWQSLYHF